MTKQNNALRLADELLEPMEGFPEPTTLEKNAAALLRTQHAAIERKDALLRRALNALCGVLDKYGEPVNVMSISGGLYEVVQCNEAISAIKKEIAS